MIREQKKRILSGEIEWSSGPKTVKELVNKFNLDKYVKPWQTICSCCFNQSKSLIDHLLPFESKHNNTVCHVMALPWMSGKSLISFVLIISAELVEELYRIK